MIYNNKVNYKKTKKGVILYSPNTVGNIHVLKTAKENRLALIESRKSKTGKFIYNDNIIHFPQKSILGKYNGNIDEDSLKIIYSEVENVLDNIEIDNIFFNNIIVSVSPFQLRGIKAFTEIYGAHKNGITLVLTHSFKAKTEEEQRIEVRKTLLHELGHVAHYKNTFT